MTSNVVASALALVTMITCALGCDSGPRSAYLSTPARSDKKVAEGSLPELRIDPEVCRGVAEMRPEYTILDESSLVRYLQARGYETRRTRARSDLVYIDVTNAGGDTPVRLRVALLGSAQLAGRELHEALLEHGPGSWGVHRANLAVLAPIGSEGQITTFAAKSQLACWGVLTVAGRDDTFVVTGGYTEL